MELNGSSITHLVGVHDDLVNLAHHAADAATKAGLEFQITEGVRSEARQRRLVASGASMTMKSRHLTGDAFDFVPIVDGQPCWKWPAFWPIVELIEKTAKELNIRVELGARWRKFPDGPHVQRPWK